MLNRLLLAALLTVSLVLTGCGETEEQKLDRTDVECARDFPGDEEGYVHCLQRKRNNNAPAGRRG